MKIRGQQDDLALKVLAMHAWRLQFDTQNPCRGKRREPAPQGYPSDLCMYTACAHIHIN